MSVGLIFKEANSMTTKTRQVAAQGSETCEYFGFCVKVIYRMEYYSLVQYLTREFIVNTEDLHCERSMKCAA